MGLLVVLLAAMAAVGVFGVAGAAPGDGAVLFQDGRAVVEAEDFDAKVPRSGHDWVAGQSPAGSVGEALRAAPDDGARLNGQVAAISPELAYRILFPAAGTHQLWLRVQAVPNGSSLHVGLEGQVASRNVSAPIGPWSWVKTSVSIPSAGEHTIQIWMRDDGLHLDRLLLTADDAFAPAGAGPAPTARAGGEPDTTPPTLDGRRPAPDAAGVVVDADVVATFSEAMDPATVTATSFTLAPAGGGPVVSAAVTASGGDAVFTLDPTDALQPGTAYTASVSSAATDRAGNALVSAGWSFATGPAPSDPTAPTLTGRVPAPEASDVPADAGVVATFSEAMAPGSVTSAGFRLVRVASGEPVPATVRPSAGDTTFTLQPEGDLAAGAAYAATVTTAARDAAGNPLAEPRTWSFTTARPATDGEGGGAVLFQNGLAIVEAEGFDERIARSGDDWAPGQSPSGSVGGALQAAPDNGSGATGDIVSTSPEVSYRILFPAAGTYYLWIRGFPPDTAGNSIHVGLDGELVPSYLFKNEFAVWGWMGKLFSGSRATLDVPSAGEHTVHMWMREDGFHLDRILVSADAAYAPSGTGPSATPRAGTGADTAPPVLADRSPTPGSATARQGGDVVVTFSEAVDPATVTPTSVRLTPAAGGDPVPATVSAASDGRSALLDPGANLAAGTTYRMTVSDVRDLAGNAMAAEEGWTFTTRSPTRYEPPDGRIYSGVSTRGVDEHLDAFLAVSNQPSVAVHNRFNRRGDPAGFGIVLGDLKRRSLTGMISWSLFTANDYSPTMPGGSHASIARGDIDEYILTRAGEVRAHGDPVFLRLHWEMNHDFFAWSAYGEDGSFKPGNSHADFRASWRRAVILFRGGSREEIDAALGRAGLPGLTAAGASVAATPNVAWVWTPGSGSSQAAEDVHAYWPGDDYVDWAGVDWYPHGTGDAGLHGARAGAPQGPSELYRRYAGLGGASSKPFLLGEWGVFGAERPAWIADMFRWLDERPLAKAQLYFNIEAADANSALQHFPQSAAAFRTGVAGDRWIRDPTAVAAP